MREHGSFDMDVDGQVIVVKVYGAWNFETTSRWCDEYKQHIDAIKNKPWTRLMDLSLWELTTPDVWELVDKVNHWANSNNQQHEVVICPLSIQKHLLERAHQVLTNVEIKFCDNLSEAKNWLKSKGF